MKKTQTKTDRTTPKGQKIGIIWTRVSTKEQADNNLSLDTQEKACREYAARNGIEIDCLLGGTNESAKVKGKLFKQMITYVAQHKRINTILVYSFDRFSRTGAEGIVTKAYLKSKGVTVVSVTQPTDPESSSGEFMEGITFLFNEYENNLRKEKCTAGMKECLERGDWYSRPPIGYEKDYSSTNKHALKIDERGRLLAKAFRWKADEDLTDTEVRERLKALGMEISKQKLSEIFHNPFYCGKIRHNLLGNRIVEGNHPPITDEETFNKVNGIATHRGYTQSEGCPETPLKLHLICPECGCHLSGYRRIKRAKNSEKVWTFWYYKCNTDGCKLNISAPKVHEKYAQLLGQYECHPEIKHIIKVQLEGILREQVTSDRKLESELKSQESKLGSQREKVKIRYGLGEIPADVYETTIRSINTRLEGIEIELTQISKSTSNLSFDVEKILVTACQLSSLWSNGSFDIRQKIQNLAFPEGVKWDREKEIPRTDVENEALRVIRLLSATCKSYKKEKTGKSFDFPAVVAEAGLEPTTSGL